MKPVLLTLFLLLLFRPAAAQTYRVTDLGTLPGGTYSQANAINNLGHVTGDADTDHTEPMTKSLRAAIRREHPKIVIRSNHAFLWIRGKMRDLEGATIAGSGGNAINDQDEVVGMAADGEGDGIPGYWGPRTTLPELGNYGVAYGINNKGEIVGNEHDYFSIGGYPFAGLQTLDGVEHGPNVTEKNSLITSATATGINDFGLVVGFADVSAKPENSLRHAVLWRKGIRQDLGTLPSGTESRAYAVNQRGQIVGSSSLRPATGKDVVLYHAFLWENGQMRDIGTLPGDKQSGANAINAQGWIVGDSGERACLWHDGKLFDLNALIPRSSGWILWGATGINNKGQIVGNGLHHGKPRGFILTPKP